MAQFQKWRRASVSIIGTTLIVPVLVAKSQGTYSALVIDRKQEVQLTKDRWWSGLPRVSRPSVALAVIFSIPVRLEDSAHSVKALVARYHSVPMDLADACLVHLAGGVGTGRILTLDRDFTVYRWGRGKAFENLIDLDPEPRRPARRVRG